MRQSGRMRRRLPQIFLVVSLLITLAAGSQAFYAMQVQRGAALRVRRQLSELAAYKFVDRASAALAADGSNTRQIFAEVYSGAPLFSRDIGAGWKNKDLVSILVRAPGGDTLFTSGIPIDPVVATSYNMGTRFAGAVITASSRQTAVGWMASESLASRSSVIVWQLIISFVLVLLAVDQMRRQSSLIQMRTDFVSSVSHELRTPLAQIQLFLETLRMGRFRDDSQRDWIFDNIQREVTRLTSLVNSVLVFSKAERGGENLAHGRTLVELAPYLQQIVDGFSPLAAIHSMDIHTEVEPGLTATLQAESFRQVILNLLDNAVKHGPERQTIRLEAKSIDGSAVITVEDEGPGVSESDESRIWEPFQRGRVPRNVAGTGIGLSVVRDIVAAHDGTASVSRAPSGGAKFIITLPDKTS